MPLLPDIIDMVQAGFVEYSYFTGMPRYRDLFRTSSQWWAYNDCVTRFRHRHRCGRWQLPMRSAGLLQDVTVQVAGCTPALPVIQLCHAQELLLAVAATPLDHVV